MLLSRSEIPIAYAMVAIFDDPSLSHASIPFSN